MANFNDLADVEFFSETIVRRIYGDISKKLTEKGVFGDHGDPLYEKSLAVLAQARALPEILLDETLTQHEKDEKLDAAIGGVQRDLEELERALK